MKASITLKRFTVSDIATKKNKDQNKEDKSLRFLLRAKRPDLPEVDQLLDLYWSGSERRITGLTLRIIAVNAVALVLLILGTLYLSQYQENLVNAKLETFKTKVSLISTALTQGATKTLPSADQPPAMQKQLDEAQVIQMVQKLNTARNQRIIVYDTKGKIITHSDAPIPEKGTLLIPIDDESFHSVQILKRLAKIVLSILPDRSSLPFYPGQHSNDIQDHPDAINALEGEISFSAWSSENESVFLSAAAPLFSDGNFVGIVLLMREAQDIERDIGDFWLNILAVFLITLILTTLLSIYLSGVIAQPLRRLAQAAESVRKGKATYAAIPDLRQRNDEIGELSIALRQMTAALWDKMDANERFAADVAHELKNPLTSLRSAVETAGVVKNKKDREKLMDIVMHDIQRIDRLISDISNASRLDTALSRETLQKINLQELLNHLIDTYKGPLDRKTPQQERHNEVLIDGVNVQLSMEIEDDLLVWGLEGRLEQVFQNLLSNSLSFSEKGSTIKIHVTKRKKQAIISFEDEGPGIPEGKLETVFERFYSERPEHESYGKHSGLGLSICKQIITALDGKIYAENIKNGSDNVSGVRFTVILNAV